MSKRSRSVRSVSSSDDNDNDSMYGDSESVIMSSEPVNKRQRKADSSTASSVVATPGKEVRREARKERNRISAQASRDRKKADKNVLENRLARAEARATQLEEENVVLLEKAKQSEEMGDQLDVLKKRFEDLERMLSSVLEKKAEGGNEGETRSQGVGSETHALAVPLQSPSYSSSTLSPPHQPLELFQPKPQSYLSFDFLDTHPETISAFEEPLQCPSNNTLDETFLLSTPELSISFGSGAQDSRANFAQDLSSFFLDQPLNQTIDKPQPFQYSQSEAMKTEDDLFFGFSFDTLSGNGGAIMV